MSGRSMFARTKLVETPGELDLLDARLEQAEHHGPHAQDVLGAQASRVPR